MSHKTEAMNTKVEKDDLRVDRDDLRDNNAERTESIELASSEKLSSPPNGGLHAWLVTIGGFGNMFCTFGFLNSFGVFQSYYQSGPLSDYSSSSISWIGSIQVFFLLFSGTFSGPLSDRYGVRAIVIPASIIHVFALMMTSLSSEYYQFILANGILLGIACGMIWTPTFAVVGQYFTTKRAWALGVVSAGASIGGIIYPIALDQMIKNERLGFPWAVRILAFMMLGIFVFTGIIVKEHAPRRTKKVFSPDAFRNGAWLLTSVGFLLASLGFWTPVYYLPEYAQSHGVAEGLIFYEVAILNGASIFGRLIPNYCADKLGRFNVDVAMTLCAAICMFCWTAARGTVGVTIFTAVYGFFQGSFASLIGPCLADVAPNASEIGTYVGMGMMVASFGALTSQPINGAIIDNLGYLSASMFSAVMLVLSALATFIAKLLIDRKVLAKV